MFYIILYSFVYLFSEQLLKALLYLTNSVHFWILMNQTWSLTTGLTLNSCPQISNGCTTLPEVLLHASDKFTLPHSECLSQLLISLNLQQPSSPTSNLWSWLILHWENRSKWELHFTTKSANLQILSAFPPLVEGNIPFPSKKTTLHFVRWNTSPFTFSRFVLQWLSIFPVLHLSLSTGPHPNMINISYLEKNPPLNTDSSRYHSVSVLFLMARLLEWYYCLILLPHLPFTPLQSGIPVPCYHWDNSC